MDKFSGVKNRVTSKLKGEKDMKKKKKGNHEIIESLYWPLPVTPETPVIPRVGRALGAPSVLVFAL